jgi:hypothetical protein
VPTDYAANPTCTSLSFRKTYIFVPINNWDSLWTNRRLEAWTIVLDRLTVAELVTNGAPFLLLPTSITMFTTASQWTLTAFIISAYTTTPLHHRTTVNRSTFSPSMLSILGCSFHLLRPNYVLLRLFHIFEYVVSPFHFILLDLIIPTASGER